MCRSRSPTLRRAVRPSKPKISRSETFRQIRPEARPMSYRVCRAETDAERADALDVRRAVFIEEQGVPESLEIDGKDDESVHVVAYRDVEDSAVPVGAGRLR